MHPTGLEKVKGPTMASTFLGVVLDTSRMEARLPEQKLTQLKYTVAEWMGKKRVTKQELMSLVGQL